MHDHFGPPHSDDVAARAPFDFLPRQERNLPAKVRLEGALRLLYGRLRLALDVYPFLDIVNELAELLVLLGARRMHALYLVSEFRQLASLVRELFYRVVR